MIQFFLDEEEIVKVQGQSYRAIWVKEKDPSIIQIIDQRHLPHEFVIEDLHSVEEVVRAIDEMHVRGAPLIGVTAAYGMYLAVSKASATNFEKYLQEAYNRLLQTRPTAVNLKWALDLQKKSLGKGSTYEEKVKLAFDTAGRIADQDIQDCKKIGDYGLEIIRHISRRKKGIAVNILTHCNAGWLACVDWGTKTAPIYRAQEEGIPLHIYVDETRPRNQGASLTAWEFVQQGIPHAVIPDNTGGHLMQHGKVDLVLVGTDRTTRTGDAANKIGTYLKALAAYENQVPFYVCAPSSSIDWNLRDGVKEIVIEERHPDEVRYVQGRCEGMIKQVLIMPEESTVANYGFDVTPARYITGIITERGICKASEDGLLKLFPEESREKRVESRKK